MFDFRLKRAQVALADGRLDEAFELLKDASLQAHHAGQKMLTRLSGAFIRRGQSHLAAQRLAPALADCLRAEKLAGNQPEVTQLRAAICQQIESERAKSQQRAAQLEKAKQQMQNGWLSTGRKILAETDDQQAKCLLKNAEILELETDSALSRIDQALKAGQIENAVRIYQNSTLRSSLNPQAGNVLERIRQQACRQLQEYLLEGRIHLACSFLNQLNGPVVECDTFRSLRQAIEYCRLAVQQIDAGNFVAAVVDLRKVQTLQPKANWVAAAIRQTQRAVEAQQELQAGPLGILENIGETAASEGAVSSLQTVRAVTEHANVHLNEYNSMDSKMRFLLQIDGIGAYHVLCNDRVTMGPVSSSRRCDIELVTAPDVRAKEIERIDGDYFIAPADSVPGGHSAKQLLNDGQRIELSPRCRFKFSLPNPASSTACLIPSSARFPRADISGVILMGREILIGPERNNHIQSGQFSEAIVLFLQDQTIRCRTGLPITINGRMLAAGQPLPMDEQIEIGDVRFSLSTERA